MDENKNLNEEIQRDNALVEAMINHTKDFLDQTYEKLNSLKDYLAEGTPNTTNEDAKMLFFKVQKHILVAQESITRCMGKVDKRVKKGLFTPLYDEKQEVLEDLK